ncbi:transposase IS4 family protein [Cytobacillus firmus]|nr:transposase IS4 family protein [Cytobacillus firmus]
MVTRPNPLIKDITYGQDYTKKFIWTMVFTNRFSLFEEQVKTLKLDFYTKKLTTESFLKLLLFAQLQEVESLHALSDCLFDDKLQQAIDLDSISISQLSRRLNGLNPDLFQRLFLRFSITNSCQNALYETCDAIKNYRFKHLTTEFNKP